MKDFIRRIQLAGAAIVLVATSLAFTLEIIQMYKVQTIQLADLLLLFIYLEVMGMVGNYLSNQSIRLTYPLFIAITALARLIILQKKDIDHPTIQTMIFFYVKSILILKFVFLNSMFFGNFLNITL